MGLNSTQGFWEFFPRLPAFCFSFCSPQPKPSKPALGFCVISNHSGQLFSLESPGSTGCRVPAWNQMTDRQCKHTTELKQNWILDSQSSYRAKIDTQIHAGRRQRNRQTSACLCSHPESSEQRIRASIFKQTGHSESSWNGSSCWFFEGVDCFIWTTTLRLS